MTDLQDIAHGLRRPPTETEMWKRRQRRFFVIAMAIGLTLLIGGLGWITPGTHDPVPGVWSIMIGFFFILAGGWFGLRALVGEPRNE